MSTQLSTPPHDLEAEMCLLGSLLLDERAVGIVSEELSAASFYQPAHQILFQVIQEIWDRRKAVDAVVLKDELLRRNQLDSIGGMEYLASLMEQVPSAANAIYYAGIVRDKATQRNLIAACHDILERARRGAEEPEELLDWAERKIFDVVKQQTKARSIKISDILHEAFSRIADVRDRMGKARMTGLPTGLYDLDDRVGGIHPSQLIIVAGRPSMGKSSLALRVLEETCLTQKKCGVLFSLEMDAQTIATNLLCSHTRYSAIRLRKGIISEEEFARLLTAAGRFTHSSLFIDDTTPLTPFELRARARRYKAEHDIDLVIVDYLQLMHSESQRRAQSRQEEIALISRSLKSLARELEVPVIALSQLSRAPESREDRRPMMSDLRESGAIEQDADLVLLLYRDEYYNPDTTEEPGTCEVLIAKHRNGPTGKVKVAFIKDCMRFENLAPGSG